MFIPVGFKVLLCHYIIILLYIPCNAQGSKKGIYGSICFIAPKSISPKPFCTNQKSKTLSIYLHSLSVNGANQLMVMC